MAKGRSVQLTLAEARAILIADEALCTSYEARLASGSTFGIDEREVWAKLVASAEKLILAVLLLHGRSQAVTSSKLHAVLNRVIVSFVDLDPRSTLRLR